MGISEQHLSNIFEPFMQVHKTSTENSRGGIGLGLSIVKKHLDQMGGTINVESELGKGSIFRIVLPRNYGKQKSRTSRLMDFVRRRSPKAHREPIALLSQAETPERKAVNTGHTIG
jgi:hypothetical protein